jgi:hypothetical protein
MSQNGVPVSNALRSPWVEYDYSEQGRNVVWCSVLNEPAILEIINGEPSCPHCKQPYEADNNDHTFIGHVVKPY